VQLIEAPGARLVSGHTTAPPTLSSDKAIPVSVTLPAFVTRYV
jgi:hypothetical protein